MKKRISFELIKKFLLAKPLYTVIVVGVVAVTVGFGLFKHNKSEEQTLVVTPGDFIQQVSVSGKVVAAQDVNLGFVQSGRISHVYGAVGDMVEKGALLAEIENGDLRAAVLQKQAALESAQAKLRSVVDGTRPEELAVRQSSVQSDQAALIQANQGVINAITTAYTTSYDAIRNKFDQFVSNPDGTNPELSIVVDAQLASTISLRRLEIQSVLSDWNKEINMLSASSDIESAASKAEQRLALVNTLLGYGATALNNALPVGSVTSSMISSYKEDIALARTNISTARIGITTARTTLASAKAALDASEKNLVLAQAGSTQADIDTQKANVSVAEADLESAEAQLSKTRIYAPFKGVITKMDAKAGEIISPSDSQISMISNDLFQIESYVPEINVALLHVGDTATVNLDAYGTDVSFNAHIVSIDPAETVQDGVSTYKTILQFENQDVRIKSGMTASLVITTLKKSGVISVPQGIIKDENGKKVVMVMQSGEKIISREVTVGDVSSLGYREITSGLAAGEVVVLSQ